MKTASCVESAVDLRARFEAEIKGEKFVWVWDPVPQIEYRHRLDVRGQTNSLDDCPFLKQPDFPPFYEAALFWESNSMAHRWQLVAEAPRGRIRIYPYTFPVPLTTERTLALARDTARYYKTNDQGSAEPTIVLELGTDAANFRMVAVPRKRDRS